MGEDLLLVGASIPYRRKPVWKAAERRIARLQLTQAGKWPKGYVEQNCPDEELDDDGEPRIGPPGAVDQLREDLRDFRVAWVKGTRSSTVWRVGNRMLLIAGGPSWGDSPSDLFDSVARLNAAGVLVAAGFDK